MRFSLRRSNSFLDLFTPASFACRGGRSLADMHPKEFMLACRLSDGYFCVASSLSFAGRSHAALGGLPGTEKQQGTRRRTCLVRVQNCSEIHYAQASDDG